MGKYAFVHIGDTHLGLKTDGVDRRDEILDIFKAVINHCVVLENEGYKVRLVLNGDLFDDHDPSEDLIACFIHVLTLIHTAGIQTHINVGNHEVVPDTKRLSCLSFIRELRDTYPTITLRETIKYTKDGEALVVTFLPHITRATLSSIGYEGTVQEYIDATGKAIMERVSKSLIPTHLVFSHLNVRQSKSGSEANLLKKSEAFLPLAFVNPQPGHRAPIVINAHIHEKQVVDNVIIPGSPLFCSFGETQDKTFLTAKIETQGLAPAKVHIYETPTPFIPFLQTEVEMIGECSDFFSLPVVTEFLARVIASTTMVAKIVLKFQVTISAENNSYDWSQVRKKVEAMSPKFQVLPILPKVVQKRVVRNIKQKPSLEPDAAVKVYLKANLGKTDQDKMKRIYHKSKPYLGVQ